MGHEESFSGSLRDSQTRDRGHRIEAVRFNLLESHLSVSSLVDFQLFILFFVT
jgi:hypothetical protein